MSHSCEWMRARLARFLDGALPSDGHAAVDAHLHACADCRAALETLREMDRLVRDAAAPSPDRAETKGEARALAALQAALHRRYDLDAAAQAREREMAAEQAGSRARTMTPEEIAGAPLDREVVRDTLAPRTAKRLSAPAPAWRWLTLGVPVAAAAVVAVVLLVREPQMHEVALERALSSSTRETPAPAMPTTAPAPAAATTAPVPTVVPPAVMKAERKVQETAAPIEADHEPTREQPTATPPAPSPPRAPIDEIGGTVTAASEAPAPAEEEPWVMLREFVRTAKDEDAVVESRTSAADVGQDRTTLLLAAEDRLLALTTAPAASEAEERPRSSEKKPSSPAPGGGVLGTLPHLRGGRGETTGFRAQGADQANAPSGAERAVERPPARLWLALADGWYLLYRETRSPVGNAPGASASATGSDSGLAGAEPSRRDGAAAHPLDAPLLAARALAAYEQAAWAYDSLSVDERARIRERIAELKTRPRH